MAMGTVDTMMVGRLSPEAIGAVSIGTSLYLVVAIFGMGLLLGLDTLVSQAFGAGKLEACHRWVFHGVYLSLMLSVPVMALVWLALPHLSRLGMNPAVLELTAPYMNVVTWSTLPLFFYATFRRYLQGMGLVKPVMIVLVTANLVNILANWILVFGHWGAPAMGVQGAAWATVSSRAYMALGLLGYILLRDRRRDMGLFHASWSLDRELLKRLFDLGLPAALQITLELGVFATATALAGKLEAASLAAHQIALTAAGLTFMVPLGVSSAGAVRVGHALGRGDAAGAERAGWMALLLGAGFMTCAALSFVFLPWWIVRAFTTEEEVIRVGVRLLWVAAFFQLFDGVQVVATGILRGAGDTRAPMLFSLLGHWLLGLPVGYVLCFPADWGVVGLWVGLSTGLIAVGIVLLFVWSRRVRQLHETLWVPV